MKHLLYLIIFNTKIPLVRYLLKIIRVLLLVVVLNNITSRLDVFVLGCYGAFFRARTSQDFSLFIEKLFFTENWDLDGLTFSAAVFKAESNNALNQFNSHLPYFIYIFTQLLIWRQKQPFWTHINNYACGHEFESRLKWKFSIFPHHLWLIISDYRGMAKWFGAHYNQEVRC